MDIFPQHRCPKCESDNTEWRHQEPLSLGGKRKSLVRECLSCRHIFFANDQKIGYERA